MAKPRRSGKPGQPGKPGRPGKSGKRGKPGKPGKSGKPGTSGAPGTFGRGGNAAFRLRQDMVAMSHALLTGTLEKLEGKDGARKCAAAMASNILTKKAWVNHRRCEVEPDLDSTSLYLLVSCSKDPIHIALAKRSQENQCSIAMGKPQWPLNLCMRLRSLSQQVRKPCRGSCKRAGKSKQAVRFFVLRRRNKRGR